MYVSEVNRKMFDDAIRLIAEESFLGYEGEEDETILEAFHESNMYARYIFSRIHDHVTSLKPETKEDVVRAIASFRF